MNIGLIDVDGHHEKKKFGATVYPNIALGKLARWHLMQGDSVEWAQPINLFEQSGRACDWSSDVCSSRSRFTQISLWVNWLAGI